MDPMQSGWQKVPPTDWSKLRWYALSAEDVWEWVEDPDGPPEPECDTPVIVEASHARPTPRETHNMRTLPEITEYMDDEDAPIDHAIAWAKDARDLYVEAGETGAARMVAAALVLLTRARVATCGATSDLVAAG
jgi:hypothetical protein